MSEHQSDVLLVALEQEFNARPNADRRTRRLRRTLAAPAQEQLDGDWELALALAEEEQSTSDQDCWIVEPPRRPSVGFVGDADCWIVEPLEPPTAARSARPGRPGRPARAVRPVQRFAEEKDESSECWGEPSASLDWSEDDEEESDAWDEASSDSWIEQDLTAEEMAARWQWNSGSGGSGEAIKGRAPTRVAAALDEAIKGGAVRRWVDRDGLAKAWDASPFFRAARDQLEWAWRCGLESESEVLTPEALKELVLRAAARGEAAELPRLEERARLEQGRCWACRLPRQLGWRVVGMRRSARYLGADCAHKLRAVVGFVSALRKLILAQRACDRNDASSSRRAECAREKQRARDKLLRKHDAIANVQTELWSKYK